MARVQLTRPRVSRHAVNQKIAGEGMGVYTPLKGGIYTPPLPVPLVGGKKEKVSVEEALAFTDRLSPADRKTLLARLALAEQTAKQGTGRDLDMWAQAVYEALVQAVGTEAGAGQGPALLKRSLGLPAAWAPVVAFMEASKLRGLTVTERQSVYALLAKMVIQNARFISRKSGAPMSAKLVSNCATHVASLFDNAFPGYVASGLALMVARQLTGPKYSL